MALDNPPADCQTDSGAFEATPTVQSLEEFEDAVEVLFIKAYAVIYHTDLCPFARRGLQPVRSTRAVKDAALHLDNRLLTSSMKLQTVADQVLQ